MESHKPLVSSKPTPAFVGASWAALFIGMLSYLIGLWNAPAMQLNEKGYYFSLLILGLFSAVSLQKAVRDKSENIPVTGVYFGLCWLALGTALLLLGVGLWNAGTITRSEKGFYAMGFVLSLFAAVAVQKNVRDMGREPEPMRPPMPPRKVASPDLQPNRATPAMQD